MKEQLGKIIDSNNDALALMGQTNYQLNMFRREQIKPELRREYRSLCNSNLPVTEYLFGDELAKASKEVEDKNKISNKMYFNNRIMSRRPMRGGRVSGYGYRFSRPPYFRNRYNSYGHPYSAYGHPYYQRGRAHYPTRRGAPRGAKAQSKKD